MQIATCNHLFVAFGPLAKPPTLGMLECQLGAVPGAFMRILEAPGVNLWRVTVAIGTEASGTLERACAWRNPVTPEWEYVRKTNHPLGEAFWIQVVAAARNDQLPTLCTLQQIYGGIYVTVQSDGADPVSSFHRGTAWTNATISLAENAQGL